jgi:hypothetical protein
VAAAKQIPPLSAEIDNAEDGLGATTARLTATAGTEDIAKEALDLVKIERWRAEAKAAIDEWDEDPATLDGPAVPDLPDLAAVNGARFMPGEIIDAKVDSAQETTRTAVKDAAAQMKEPFRVTEEELAGLVASHETSLQDQGFEQGSEALAEIGRLQTRLTDLDSKSLARDRLRDQIEEHVAQLEETVDLAQTLHDGLTSERRDTCAAVNPEMRSFYSRVDVEGAAANLDGLIETAMQGSYVRRTNVPAIRDTLDRKRLLTMAIWHAAGEPGRVPDNEDLADQDEISRVAIDRGRTQELARLSIYWPGATLHIESRDGSIAFEELTEGMRALAIKEISFASSSRPVVSDQPEDAVPSQAVFDNLVPTLRSQRASRQFVLASHDANVVVAGDAEAILVLRQGDEPISGDLSDARICSAAMDLLEGGREAFGARTKRYRRLDEA